MYYDEFIEFMEFKKFNRHLSSSHCSCHDELFHDRNDCCDREFSCKRTLSNEFSFRLRKLIDCDITIEIFSGENIEKIRAKLDFVGSDFIEVCLKHEHEKPHKEWEHYKLPKERNESKKRIIPMESIKCIDL
ncbi:MULTISPECIES: hypothetical protein [Bacillaceae]|uniref:hypothetical protein n=1 Tax=Bacillaceae TaxID=186817 RepID=UPI000BFE1293|nr:MULTISPECIES: hypothetical protein [Bacillaceae]PGT81053.1 hypothetical protein COD11_18930 [Bacillus sp. AFS040349]UGB32175.1 hypothetical protein LPC09_06845 [Metabacillus sp. B2-18]